MQPLDLSAVQRDLLAIVADGERNGLELFRELRRYHALTRRPFYGHLSTLVDVGYVRKEQNGRENRYSLTSEGWRALERDLRWRRQRIGD